MNKFVTIKTFTYVHQLSIIQGRLESEGIQSRVQDELTVQVDPFYSNAIGGVKLQVKESDVERAMEIMKEGGFLKDEELQPSKLFKKLDEITASIPLLKELPFELKLFSVLAILVLSVLCILYYINR